MMQLSQIAAAVNGQLIGANEALQGVTIDSRADCQQQLFVALKGERFDGHDYLQQAKANGAVAVMVEQASEVDIPSVLVADTHQALKDFAAWWRSQFVIPVVGVTGSVGKTSVKEMLAAIFAEIGCGLVTKGNLNNEIGVPLTLLRLTQDDQYAIVEMGMNHSGEISRLTAMAKPTIALVNNAAAAHLEGLGSVEGVAKAKGEIFEGLSKDGVGIVNADDQYADLWRALIGDRRILSFGLSNDADISASYELSNDEVAMQVKTPQDSFAVKVATVGRHNVMNALAAIAVATAANIPADAIQAGLARYRPINGRLNISKIGGLTLIDDTYNANPASMAAAVEVLSQYQHSILVVGDMAELGDAAKEEHLLLGEFAKQNKINLLFAYGQFAEFVVQGFSGDGYAFDKQTDLIDELAQIDLSATAVLVKGSRSAKMERVVESLLSRFSASEQSTNKTFNDEGRASC